MAFLSRGVPRLSLACRGSELIGAADIKFVHDLSIGIQLHIRVDGIMSGSFKLRSVHRSTHTYLHYRTFEPPPPHSVPRKRRRIPSSVPGLHTGHTHASSNARAVSDQWNDVHIQMGARSTEAISTRFRRACMKAGRWAQHTNERTPHMAVLLIDCSAAHCRQRLQGTPEASQVSLSTAPSYGWAAYPILVLVSSTSALPCCVPHSHRSSAVA